MNGGRYFKKNIQYTERLGSYTYIRCGGISYKGVLKLNIEDVSFDLNGKVPKLYIKGREVGVVSMTTHYVTSHDSGAGCKVVTFVYLTEGDSEQKVLSINQITAEVMNQ